MSVSPNNSLPRVIALGIDDQSEELLPIELEAIPVHLPLCPILGPWGPEFPVLTGSGGAQRIYGSEIFDVLTPYYTHQNVLAQEVSAEGNLVYFMRQVMDDATTARFRLSLDLVEEPALPTYERNDSGSYRLDQSGERVETGNTIAGYRGRWVLQEIAVVNDEYTFGMGEPSAGFLVNSAGTESTLYPMLDFETRWRGKRGDNIGVRIQAPTSRSMVPADVTEAADMSAFVYRFFAVQRSSETASASIINTTSGGQYVEAVLRPGTINPNTRTSMDVRDRFLEAYESSNPENFTGYGPFAKLHVYNENLEKILGDVYANEEAYSTIQADVADPKHLINPFTAVTLDNIPLWSLQLDGPADGGLLFTENTTHWARDGSDGTLSEAAFEAKVGELADKFIDFDSCEYRDMLQYPFSFFWDSGFSSQIKEKLPAFTNRRNMIVVEATQVANAPLNTGDRESSMAVSLRALLRAYPESDQYGTGHCRGLIVGNGGRYLNSAYRGVLPFTIGLARRVAAHMGAATGIFNKSAAIDVNPNNIISDYANHNVVAKPEGARAVDWTNGLIFAQAFDTRRHFWAGLRTVYDSPTSILTSFINVVILARCTWVAHRGWSIYTGNGTLSDSQYVERVDDYIREEAKPSYFEDRMQIDPVSQYTAGDRARNFSYSTQLRGAGRGMKTVQNLTIIAARQEAETTQEG